MSLKRLLGALSHVRAGPDQSWTARCPAHEDRDPSLSIRALPDGRILIHCFAGCPVGSVVAAVGMELSDLMPPRPRDGEGVAGGWGPNRRYVNRSISVAHEALIVAAALERHWSGSDLSLADEDRVMLAVRRLREPLP